MATDRRSTLAERKVKTEAPNFLSPVNGDGRRKPNSSTCDLIPVGRCNSRQSRYHEECKPQVDSTLLAGSRRSRLDSAQFQRAKSARERRPSSKNSKASCWSQREGVVNLVYVQPSGQDTSESDTDRLSERRYFRPDGRARSVLSTMTTPTYDASVPSRDYPVVEEADYSWPKYLSSRRAASQSQSLDYQNTFLYQVVSFDSLTENMPLFVKQNMKKNGRLLPETLILRINYLRRRRQVGETSHTNRAQQQQQQQQRTVVAVVEMCPP